VSQTHNRAIALHGVGAANRHVVRCEVLTMPPVKRFVGAGFAWLLIATAPAMAACQQWGVGSQVALHQQVKLGASRIEYLLFLRLKQDGERLTGDAELFHAANPPRAGAGLKGAFGGRGPAGGVIRGNSIEVSITYSPQHVAVYRGTVDAEGHASGTTFARANPRATMAWYTAGTLQCAVERDVDRQGGDYRNFELTSDSYELCRAACTGEQQCKAYTYVKPGVQGQRARCWLKTARVDKRTNGCCVSGVVR
jgi:hypothetical protein